MSHRYVPREGMHSSSARVLTSQIRAVRHALRASSNDHQLRAADRELQTVLATITREATKHRIKSPVTGLLSAQIDYCRCIIGYVVSRQMR